MINLFTGTPGSGKTAFAVSSMLELVKEGRPLFVHGIPELNIPHEVIVCYSPSCSVCSSVPNRDEQLKAENWHEWAPDGAIIFIDEVQNVYRPRSSASKVPDSIMAFETHRHKGLDFYLISQSPRLFDSNIRRLVNRHVHLKSTFANKIQYEWSECQDNTQSVTAAVKSNYKIDKKVFDLYKSSSLHTKVKRKIPLAVYILPVLLIAVVLLGLRIYGSIESKTISSKKSSLKEKIGVAGEAQADTAAQIFDLYQPLDPNRPESAPIYAHLLKVKDFPRITACVFNNDSGQCKCYTQQGTEYKTSLSICYSNAMAKAFNPYLKPLPDKVKPANSDLPVDQPALL